MTNEALQAFIEELGDRICVITLDNVGKIYVGYDQERISSVKVSDIQMKTFGGIDMFSVPVNALSPREARLGIKGRVWHPTFTIHAIVVIDEEFKDYRFDPAQFT